MATYTAGDAGIEIHPDFGKFITELRADLESVDASLGVEISADIAKATADLDRWRAEQVGKSVSVLVDLDAERARVGLDELTRARVALIEAQTEGVEERRTQLDELTRARIAQIEARTEGTAAVQAQLAELARTRTALIQTRLDRTTASSAERELGSALDDLKSVATLSVKIVGAVGAGAVIADLLAVADAASQASRALALLPAAGGALAFGGISAAIGAHGISGAFKAYSTANADPAANAIKQRDALNAVAEAQYQVGTAERASQTATRELTLDEQSLNTAYTDASRSIRDMNLSLKEQKLNVTDAALAVSEAAKTLQKVQYDPTADADARQKAADDYQRAIIGQQQAQNKLNDSTQDTAVANAKGVAGSAAVVAAKQKVSDGIQAEADAAHSLSQALIGVQKAEDQVAQSGGQSKINASLAKLSPDAKELVADVRSLGPAWTDVRIAGQDALTNGLGPSIKQLADEQLPAFKAGVVGVDDALNTGLKATITELSSPSSKANFGVFLDNTVSGFHNAAGAAAPFTQSITTLATAGSKELPALGQAVDDMATKFDNLVLRTTTDGQFDAWMSQGITSAEQLGGVLEHLGSSVASVFRAAGDGGSVVQSLDDLTGKMSAFLKSAQGQTELGSIFTELRQGTQDLAPLLKDLPGLLHGVIEGFQLWGGVAGPILHDIASLLADNPRLVEVAIAAYAGFKTVKPVLDGVSTGLEALATRGGWVKPAADKAGDALKGLGEKAEGAGDKGGIGKFKAAGQGLLNLFGSPWTLGIGLAVSGFEAFQTSADSATAAVQRLSTRARQSQQDDAQLQKDLQASGGNLDSASQSDITQGVSKLRQGYSEDAKDSPGIWDKAQEGLTGIVAGLSGIGSTALQNDRTRDDMHQQGAAAQSALDSLGLSSDQLTQKITGSKSAFDDMTDRLSKMGQGGKDAAGDLQGLRDEWAIDAASVHPVTDAMADLYNKSKDAVTSIGEVTQALQHQRDNNLSVEDAQRGLNEALLAIGDNAKQASGAIVDATGKIDTSTHSGDELSKLLGDQLAPAWDKATAAAEKDAEQHGATATQVEQAGQRAAQAAKDSSEKSIESLGYTQTQADLLLQHLGLLDKDFHATATLDTSQATAAIAAYEKFLDDTVQRGGGSLPFLLQPLSAGLGAQDQYHRQFPNTQSVPGAPSPVPPWLSGVVGHATGGLLTGTGTSTSDSMIIRASTGEFVESEGAVDKYGVAFFQALNEGRIDPKLIAMLPGYATGGQPGSAPASPGAPSTSSTNNIAAVIALAQAVAGQPYGGALDCSGLISQLALKADGLSPDSGRMSTANEGPWLGALGWTLGNGGGNGVFSVGWINDPSMPGGGHTAGTLPDGNNIEASGSANKVLYGPGALGANASLFNQHAYLNMSSATVNTASGGLGTPAPGTLATPTPGVNSTPVLNPQVAAPVPQSDQQLQIVQDRAAFDAANSQRNAVYANPASTQQDKTAADYAYDKAANTLGSAMQQQSSGAATLFSAQGAGTALGIGLGSVIGAAIGASIPGGQGAAVNAGIGGSFGNTFGGKLGGILAGGLLSSLGLDNSILSSSNSWNSAFQQGIAASGTAFGTGGLGAYGYIPKNLPSVVTTTTPQATPTDPGTASYAGTGTAAPTAANAAAVHTYNPAGGSQQWLGTVQQILQATGRNVADASETVSQIGIESSGNPNAENDTPAGIAAGTPIGLLQVIKTTFGANADPRFPGDQRTPSANIAAALNYVDHRYGGPSHIWPTAAGYADGGWLSGPGGPRGDQIPIWGSDDEFMVNAASAADNAALLESINAGASFKPLSMPSNFDPRPADNGGGQSIDNSMHFGDVTTLNHHDFTRRLDSWSAQQAMPFLVAQ